MAALRLVNGTLECPTQEDPHPYWDPPEGFWKHLQGVLFPPWVIGSNAITACEAHIVGAECAHEWSRWCATPRKRERQQHSNFVGQDMSARGTERPQNGYMRPQGPHTGWRGNVSWLLQAPLPPLLVPHTANILRAAEIHTWDCNAATVRWRPREEGSTQLTVAHFKKGGLHTMTPCPGWATFQGPCFSRSPPTSPPRCATSWTVAMG